MQWLTLFPRPGDGTLKALATCGAALCLTCILAKTNRQGARLIRTEKNTMAAKSSEINKPPPAALRAWIPFHDAHHPSYYDQDGGKFGRISTQKSVLTSTATRAKTWKG